MNITPINYTDLAELLGVDLNTLRHAVSRGVLTRLPKQGLVQPLIKEQGMLFQGKKRLSLASLKTHEREQWEAYAQRAHSMGKVQKTVGTKQGDEGNRANMPDDASIRAHMEKIYQDDPLRFVVTTKVLDIIYGDNSMTAIVGIDRMLNATERVLRMPNGEAILFKSVEYAYSLVRRYEAELRSEAGYDTAVHVILTHANKYVGEQLAAA